MPIPQLQLFAISLTPQPAVAGQHPRTAEFFQQRHKAGIGADTATPQGNRLHPPARQLGGMGFQRLGINPDVADQKRSRPAVGDQVQHPRRITLGSPLPQTPADPLQRMALFFSGQHRQLRPDHQGLDLRTAPVCHQALLCFTGTSQG